MNDSLSPGRQRAKKKLVYFVTEDWYFCSHRLPLARAARAAGYDVFVVTNVSDHEREIESAQLNLIAFNLSRTGRNPFAELVAVFRLIRIYRRIRPDVVHNVAVKPVIYGTIAARLARVPNTINAMAGLGFLFTSESMLARVLRPMVVTAMRLLMASKRTTVIVQNPDDLETLRRLKIVDADRAKVILGSGVDPAQYAHVPEPVGKPVVLMASRLLWDKGVGEFAEAARLLAEEDCDVRFVLAGDIDTANPSSVSEEQLDEWVTAGHIEWVGHQDDMVSLISNANIVCLPSYREGVPKFLIEAASCGRPIVTTDTPGCREIVGDGENGILVPVKDAEGLATAIRTLLGSAELRRQMGSAGRQKVKQSFALDRVIEQTMALY